MSFVLNHKMFLQEFVIYLAEPFTLCLTLNLSFTRGFASLLSLMCLVLQLSLLRGFPHVLSLDLLCLTKKFKLHYPIFSTSITQR